MGVFGMAVDTALQCFVMDEELNGTVGEHTPPQLKQFPWLFSSTQGGAVIGA